MEKTKKKKEEAELSVFGGGGDHRPSLFSHCPDCFMSLPLLSAPLSGFSFFYPSSVFRASIKTGCQGIQNQALLVGVAPLGSVASLIILQWGG